MPWISGHRCWRSAILPLVALLACISLCQAADWIVKVIDSEPTPIISYLNGNSDFFQAFNPSWVQPSATQPKYGLLVRSQNCSFTPGECLYCNVGHNGTYPSACSVIAFLNQTNDIGSDQPAFEQLVADSVVFQPDKSSPVLDTYGTEDPRLALGPNGTYYLFYTAYGPPPLLALASTQDPTRSDGWARHGAVFPNIPNSKSGALLVRDKAPHYLLWGAGNITLATTDDFLSYENQFMLLSPRSDYFDNGLVESGPPPMMLSSGDYLFFYNSADENESYHPGWLILNGTNPGQILARSEEPLLSPDLGWQSGIAPYECNVPNVVFLEAAHPAAEPDTFRVYFGGSDAVIGTALIQVVVPTH